ncbi:MAG: hypothetical protein WEC75_10390 [Dehalococcoidia bacterium]
MTTQEPMSDARATYEVVAWLQDQFGQFKTAFSRMQQQNDQLQAALLDVNEKLRDAEGRLREMTARTLGLPTMQEQLRQVSGLLDRIQDAEVLIDTKFEMLERSGHEEHTRDQTEKNDLFKRLQEMERRVEGLTERQASVDEASRRFQDEVARSHVQSQQLSGRLEGAESKVARSIEALMRLEQQQAEADSAIRTLRREDDALAERARLAHEVAARIETELHQQQEEYRELPLLSERVELLRAERQRLEDRTSHMEESLEDARLRLERQEELTAQLDARTKSHDARMDHVHNATLDFRRSLTEQLLKLNQLLERMKRRGVEEMEREIKELRAQAGLLKSDE